MIVSSLNISIGLRGTFVDEASTIFLATISPVLITCMLQDFPANLKLLHSDDRLQNHQFVSTAHHIAQEVYSSAEPTSLSYSSSSSARLPRANTYPQLSTAQRHASAPAAAPSRVQSVGSPISLPPETQNATVSQGLIDWLNEAASGNGCVVAYRQVGL